MKPCPHCGGSPLTCFSSGETCSESRIAPTSGRLLESKPVAPAGSERVPLLVHDDVRILLRRYTDWSVDVYQTGEMSKERREEMRSYAAEIVHALLRDNPTWHPDYTARMAAIAHERRWGRAPSAECTCPDCREVVA